MTPRLPRLHAITNDAILALPDFSERVARITAVPGTAVHVRSGSLGGRKLSELAVTALHASVNGAVFVNDRADVARFVDAAGVHLPSRGLSVAQTRAIVGANRWIGRSAHSVEEVVRAGDEGADYVFLGPIWPTASHPNAEPLGPKTLSRTGSIPVIAIGGVTPKRVTECIEHGAYGIAVISALWYEVDVISAARDLSLSFST